MISTEIEQFNDWVTTLGVVPIIAALRQKANTIQAETMASIENKMPNLTDRERKILSKHTKSIVNQLLKEPILQVKELSAAKDPANQLQLFQQIFGIEEDVQKEVALQEEKAKINLKQTLMESQNLKENLQFN